MNRTAAITVTVLTLALTTAGFFAYRKVQDDKQKAAQLEAETLAAKKRAEEEAKRLEAQVAEMKAKNLIAERQSAALAGLMEKSNSLDTFISSQLEIALRTSAEAQQSLLASPSAANFASLKSGYKIATQAIATAQKAVAECETYMVAQADDLKTFGPQTQAVTAKLAEGKPQLAAIMAAVERSAQAARESKFAVLAEGRGWQASDLSVETGEQIAIEARGTWKWALQLANPTVGPEGTNGDVSYRLDDNYHNGALLLRIRGSEGHFPGYGHVVPDRAGKVEFAINDSATGDNSGTMDVTMWAILPLGQGK